MENKVMKNGNIYFDGREYTEEEFDVKYKELCEESSAAMRESIRIAEETKIITDRIMEKLDRMIEKNSVVVKDRIEEKFIDAANENNFWFQRMIWKLRGKK